jgi:hypothetical protein
MSWWQVVSVRVFAARSEAISGEAVGGEQEGVAGGEGGLEEVGLDVGVDADGAGDDGLQRRALGLRLGHGAEADLLGDPGVVVCELSGYAGADEIGAAVADVDQGEVVAVQAGGDERGAHAAKRGVHRCVGEDGAVGGGNGAGERTARAFVAVFTEIFELLAGDGEEGFTGEVAGDLATGGAAHAVADDVEAEFVVAAEAVLVDAAKQAKVGLGGDIELLGDEHGTAPNAKRLL